MILIKEGKIEEIWIGKCRDCKSIIEADENELTIESDQREADEWAWDDCIFCKKKSSVIFYKVGTSTTKTILRKAGFSGIYKTRKKK